MGKRVQILRGQWEIEFIPGWYRIHNSRKLHYFNGNERSLCWAHTCHEPMFSDRPGYPKCHYCQIKLNNEKNSI